MRTRNWKIDTFGVFFAGLLAVAIVAPVRAQSSSAAGVDEPTQSKTPDADAEVGRGMPPPRLADVDIEALLDHSNPAPDMGADASVAPPLPERAQQALVALTPDGGWGAVRGWSESVFAQAVEAANRHIPEETRRTANDLLATAGPLFEELRRALLLALGVLVAGLLSLHFVRGKGDLTISIEYPSELRGTFNVRVARSRAGAMTQNRRIGRIATPAAAQRAKRNAGSGSRTERTLVSRETQFNDLVTGSWFVTIDGFLQAADGDEVLATHQEEREIRTRRGKTVRVVFDFHPRDCPIDVKVLWDRKPVTEAMVSLRGQPGSQRYARGGPVRIGASLGSHTLVIGSADRVAEHPLEVRSFVPQAITVDLTGRDNVLFAGCPPAVEPYLHGDVPGAARALEREGQTEVANLLLGRLHSDLGQKDIASRHFEAAGHPLEAAELQRDLMNYARAATLFETAGETALAAEMYRSAGDFSNAGAAYERAARYDSAVECYREGGDLGNWIGSLERMGAAFEAAEVSIENDDWGRAIRSLQLVAIDDPDYTAAANLLVDAYLREGHLDLAAAKIDEILQNAGPETISLETCDGLADQLEESGEYERALEMLEVVRARDATYPNLATRIECLKKRLSDESETNAADATAPGAAFTSGFRYEILEEIGRGGMGVVFKARDKRLGRVVALKRLPDNLRNHPKAIQLFLREARAAAALNHPNIVTLFDADQEGDTFYITMELLEGSPLQSILHKRGQLAARDVARLGIQVAGGLQYAHEQRVIHRDIKTGNLFFTNRKRLKIMDFGLAKMVEEVRRASTVIGGTPYYMAPEQAVGGRVDARADIYALGVTLYELLTGAVPFTEGDVTYHHRHTPPPDPRERCDGLPDSMAELVLHMLAKNADDRCGSAARVAERLQEISKLLG
jgi:tRNA A-37 threonylcarbamoyl transferase component Bud32